MAEDKKEKSKEQSAIKLRVVEALQDDAYKGIARVDTEVMKELGIKRGDIILIKGQKETVAIADRAYPADVGEGTIRIDGILRRNAKTGVGENVVLKKAEVKEAKKVLIAPVQKGVMVQADPDTLKSGLLGRAFIKGDILVLGGMSQRKRDMLADGIDMNELFGDIEKMFGGAFGGMPMGLGRGIQQIKFVVAKTTPEGPIVITENTEVELSNKSVEILETNGVGRVFEFTSEGGVMGRLSVVDVTDRMSPISYEDIGGLSEEVKKIREMVELPLKHPEIFEKLGIEAPRGVLLYGPPGTGKTLLARAVANESRVNIINLTGSFISGIPGETEKRFSEIFKFASDNSPCIIFIDELDSIAFKREERGHNEFLNTPGMELLRNIDGLKSRGKVVVIGATNRPEALDPAFRRPGRFDREVEVGVPDKLGRLAILKIHTRGMPLTKDVNLEELASITHGFVGADVSALAKEAAMSVLRRILPDWNMKSNDNIPGDIYEKLKITKHDFEEALKIVRPSAMREVLVEVSDVKWTDIGGLGEVKIDLKEAVEIPLKNPEAFERIGIRPPRGILLYGPPGTGKTYLAKAIATESDANFISIKGPELISKWIGDSAGAIRRIFKKARQVAPCIIFFDEIDSIAYRRGNSDSAGGERENILNQLLVEFDGLEELKDVVVIGATNRPDILDPAILRPGRFDRIIYVPVPDVESREAIFKIHTKNMPISGVNIKELAEKTEGYTGADIEALCREAGMLALREDINVKFIHKTHFEKAMERISPSVSKKDAERYKNLEKEYLKNAKAALPDRDGPNYLG